MYHDIIIDCPDVDFYSTREHTTVRLLLRRGDQQAVAFVTVCPDVRGLVEVVLESPHTPRDVRKAPSLRVDTRKGAGREFWGMTRSDEADEAAKRG